MLATILFNSWPSLISILKDGVIYLLIFQFKNKIFVNNIYIVEGTEQ